MAGEQSRRVGRLGGRPKGSKDLRTAVQAAARHEVEVFTARRVLEEIAACAFIDIGDLYHDDGRLKMLSKMPAHARRAIAGLKSTTYNKAGVRDGLVEEVVDVRLVPKQDALRMAAQFHALLVETKVDATNDADVRARMRRGEERARKAGR